MIIRSELLSSTHNVYVANAPFSIFTRSQIGDVHAHDPPINNLDLVHLITTLKKLGLKVCLCTSDSRSSTYGALKNWGIFSLFDSIVTCDDVEPGFEKPSPAPMLNLCKAHGIKPCVVVPELVGEHWHCCWVSSR